MDVKTGLYAYLTSKALLTDLIALRIWPEGAAEGASLPYVTYEFQDDNHERHLRGASSLANYQVTLTVHADTSDSRDAVSEALRNILHTRRNVTLSGSIDLRSATLDRRFDSLLSPDNGTEAGIFEAELDFTLILFETAPTLP